MFDCILKNAVVVTPQKAQKLTIAVKNEKIAGLFSPDINFSAKEEFDFSGKIIFPGVIDSHAHVTFCSDFDTGSYTAASGGVTTLVEMPQSGHLTSLFTPAVLNERIHDIKEHSIVDCALYGGIRANDFSNAEALIQKGVAAFKIFLSDAGDYGSFDEASLMALFQLLKPSNCLVAVHAEDQSICTAETLKMIETGKGAEANSDSRPILSEILAVERLCTLALEEHARISVCHISSKRVIEIIRHFRQRNLNVTAETCPHYLLLNNEDVVRCGAWAKCAPPIRSQEEVDNLWECILQGEIDMIGSDHATYSDEQKSSGSFWNVPGGFPGLDLILPGLYSEGICRRGLSLTQLAYITATNPAKIFGLSGKGSIEIGNDADFAVLDPDSVWTFHAKDSFYKPKSSHYPYEGKTFHGQVISTFVRGKQIYSKGNILTKQHGRYIPSVNCNL